MSTRAFRLIPFYLLPLTFAVAATACAQGATLVRETPGGGIVSYLYREARGGPLGSPYRGEALALVGTKCPFGYTIVREGETRLPPTVQTLGEGTVDESRYRRWSLQYRCEEFINPSSKNGREQP